MKFCCIIIGPIELICKKQNNNNMKKQTKTIVTLGLGLLWSSLSFAQTNKGATTPTTAQQPKPSTSKPASNTTPTSPTTGKPSTTTKPAVTKPAAPKPLEIGQEHLGGIIIKLNADGKTGLIAAKQDLDQQYNWADAKTACDNLVVTGPNYDFTDWRLPSLDELQIYQNLFFNNLGGFTSSAYWTSSKAPSQESAICYVFDKSKPTSRPYLRTGALKVRPVRTF